MFEIEKNSNLSLVFQQTGKCAALTLEFLELTEKSSTNMATFIVENTTIYRIQSNQELISIGAIGPFFGGVPNFSGPSN